MIEILAALAILSMTAAIVMINAPPSRDAAQREATLFAMRLQQALDHASISGVPMRLVFADGGYEISERRDGAWRAFYPVATSGEVTTSAVRFERNEAVTLMENSRFLGGGERETDVEQFILIDPAGGVDPFTARFGANPAVAVSLDAAGQVKVVQE